MGQARSTQTTKSPGFGVTIPNTSIHHVEADGVRVFYRAAGDPDAPVVLLLHGFPASSFMFRELIPRLASEYRVIAPAFLVLASRKFPPNESMFIRSTDWQRRSMRSHRPSN